MTRAHATSTLRRIARVATKNQRSDRGPGTVMTTDGRTRTADDMMSEAALRVGTFSLFR